MDRNGSTKHERDLLRAISKSSDTWRLSAAQRAGEMVRDRSGRTPTTLHPERQNPYKGMEQPHRY